MSFKLKDGKTALVAAAVATSAILAAFAEVPTLTLADGVSAVWGEAAWQADGAAASAPASGDAVVVLSGDATLALDGDIALDSLSILGTGTLTIARGAHAYSIASTITASETDYLVTLADGKVVFDYDDEGKIAELRMTPDPGETLTLDDGRLDFAAGARILPGGQTSDQGGRSVIVGGFTAESGLEIAGVTNMTWTGGSLLGNTSTLLFQNAKLDELAPSYCYARVGTSTSVSYTDTYLFHPYNLVRDGDTLRFEMQKWDGTHTKGFLMELVQSGDDIVGRRLIAGYFSQQNKLGQPMFKYENGTASRLSGVSNASYYQPKRIVIGPRGGRSKLTFSVDGAQTLPALSGGGVEVTFDANGRGELAEEFKSGTLANNGNWQTLTTAYSLRELRIGSARIGGSWVSAGADAIAYGWTNNHEYAGCQLQQLQPREDEDPLIRTVDIELRQNGNAVEYRWVRCVYTYTNASTYYGKKYLTIGSSGYKTTTVGNIRALWISSKAAIPTATVTASGANTMTDGAYVIRADDVNHAIEFNAANVYALADKTTDCYGNSALRLTAGGTYTAGIRGAEIAMHPGTTLYSLASWTFHHSAQTVVIDGATLDLNDSSKYINSLVLTNGAVVTRGASTRVGYNVNPTWRVAGEGVSTCASDVDILAAANTTKRSWTIDVADTVAGEASDFIMYGDIANDPKYPNGTLVKSGPGTMEMQGTLCTSNNAVHVTAGTLLLGKTGAAAPEVSFSLEGGALALAAGTAHEAATLYVQQADSALALGEDATLAIANLSISDGKTLTLSGDVGKESLKVSARLDASTLKRIAFADGRSGTTVQSEEGYIRKSKGFVLIVR